MASNCNLTSTDVICTIKCGLQPETTLKEKPMDVTVRVNTTGYHTMDILAVTNAAIVEWLCARGARNTIITKLPLEFKLFVTDSREVIDQLPEKERLGVILLRNTPETIPAGIQVCPSSQIRETVIRILEFKFPKSTAGD